LLFFLLKKLVKFSQNLKFVKMTFSLSYKVILDWFKMFKPCLLPFANLAVYSVLNSCIQEVAYVLVHFDDSPLITITSISLAHIEGADDVHCLCMQPWGNR